MRKQREDKVDAELIDGKPYFGLWFGSYVMIDGDAFVGDLEKNPMIQMTKDRFNSSLSHLPLGLEIRHKQFIIRPPYSANPLMIYGTVGVKYVIWGRAFEVMKRLKKGVPRWRKMRRSGKIKWVRVDR